MPDKKQDEMSGKIEMFVPKVHAVRAVRWTGKNEKEVRKLFGDKIDPNDVLIGAYLIEDDSHHIGIILSDDVMKERFKRVVERWGVYDKKVDEWALGRCYWRPAPNRLHWAPVENYPFESLSDAKKEKAKGYLHTELRSKLIEVED